MNKKNLKIILEKVGQVRRIERKALDIDRMKRNIKQMKVRA